MDLDCQGGETAPVNKRKWEESLKREGKPRGLLDQLAVLSCFTGKEFVHVCVCPRVLSTGGLHGTSFSS